MTIEELSKLTDFQFEYIVQCTYPENAILFGIPIPSPFGEGLHWHRTETGGITIDEDIDAWEDAWEAYTNSLQAPVTVATNGEEKPPKRKNRTRMQAEQAGAITVKGMPEHIANVTIVPYRQGMTVIGNGDARLQPILPELAERLKVCDLTAEPSGLRV